MSNIVRDSDVVELNGPPAFRYGEKVRSLRTVRNDGTYPGKEIGDLLVKKGEEGVVTSIGTFLQQFYIYGVDFPETGHRVGMKRRELAPMADDDGRDDDLPSAFPAAILSGAGA
ncbi:nitrogen fixation protein NifZ [Novosphingobium nitrogenifigens DSM 19370]|uniref:Nitrogen fixation protein NifZ n=1 Tax=Novosphingobium nitrogenifigens DSM 19370 TaxID=983920 RepID=F1Z4T6_9SPHN|nr:nitrogen fixation protein NifZ [Novosphingobium nitrogenifigens]EGD60377.1 nitrogen fixation protein NifZ [Novosphingobium nitrogenifigens DSM 19370]